MRFASTLLVLSIASAAHAQSATAKIADFCPNVKEALADGGYPRAAMIKGLGSGDVVVSFTVTTDDQLADVVAVDASNVVFADAAMRTVRKLNCKSGGEARHLRIPFSYRLDIGSSYSATSDDIPADRLRDVSPQIAELKVTPDRFSLKLGDGLRIDTLKVLAYDRTGKFLGRLRQFTRDAQPKDVLAMRGAGIVQGSSPGVGFLELSAPTWDSVSLASPRPTVRVEITVSE